MINCEELPWDLISIGAIMNAMFMGDITPDDALKFITLFFKSLEHPDPGEPVQTEFCLENGKMLSEALV